MKKLLLFLLLLPALCRASNEPDSLTLVFHLYDGIMREELPAAKVFVRDAADSTLLATERRSHLTEENYGEKKILQTTVYARVPGRPIWCAWSWPPTSRSSCGWTSRHGSSSRCPPASGTST